MFLLCPPDLKQGIREAGQHEQIHPRTSVTFWFGLGCSRIDKSRGVCSHRMGVTVTEKCTVMQQAKSHRGNCQSSGSRTKSSLSIDNALNLIRLFCAIPDFYLKKEAAIVHRYRKEDFIVKLVSPLASIAPRVFYIGFDVGVFFSFASIQLRDSSLAWTVVWKRTLWHPTKVDGQRKIQAVVNCAHSLDMYRRNDTSQGSSHWQLHNARPKKRTVSLRLKNRSKWAK